MDRFLDSIAPLLVALLFAVIAAVLALLQLSRPYDD